MQNCSYASTVMGLVWRPCTGERQDEEFSADAIKSKLVERGANSSLTYFFAGSLWPFAANASPKALRGPPPAGFW